MSTVANKICSNERKGVQPWTGFNVQEGAGTSCLGSVILGLYLQSVQTQSNYLLRFSRTARHHKPLLIRFLIDHIIMLQSW